MGKAGSYPLLNYQEANGFRRLVGTMIRVLWKFTSFIQESKRFLRRCRWSMWTFVVFCTTSMELQDGCSQIAVNPKP